MFKIKGNVDLKKLEKFGFYQDNIGLNKPYIIYVKNIKPYVSIQIFPQRQIIKYIDEQPATTQEKDIQDLIQAGLVEKI